MPPAKLEYRDDGPKNGSPVLLLHGFPLDAEMWDAQAKYLAGKGLRVIRPDLRGHGKSPSPDEPSTMERLVEDVLALMDRLGIDTFRLGGFSVGGYAALELIRRHGQRVTALLLVDTRAEPDTDQAKENRRNLIQQIRTRGAAALVEAMLPKLLSDQTRKSNPGLEARVRAKILRASAEGSIHILEGMMQRPDQRPNLASIKVPTLIVVGAEDKITPPEAARALQSGIAQSQLRIVTGAAHLVPEEQPEPLNHFLDHWLKGFVDKKPGMPWKPQA
jgi:3-oxoadipate enol-lactonase